jgi:hypothetical protein
MVADPYKIKFLGIKNYNLPIPMPPSLKREQPALQNMKFPIFCFVFVGHFCPPGSGSTDPVESGSNTDPDPQACIEEMI